MIDDLTNKYDDFKNVIDVLPLSTKYNRKRKMDYILEALKEDDKRLELVDKEIHNRINYLDNLKSNDKVNELTKELEKCNIVNEWNIYNTPYEKMHLDYYLYQLNRYYKEDLISVNKCIKRILESFKKVEKEITKEDFTFNNYVRDYMDKIISGSSNEELVKCFEDYYWKNPDILKTIEINFKSIYLKNEKKIIKFYNTRHEEYLKTHKDEELYDLRIKLSEEVDLLKRRDAKTNFEKFLKGEYLLGDYKDVDKKKEKYFNEANFNYDSLSELDHVLNEYDILIKYKYLFDDMKDKLSKKDEYKDVKSKTLKEINSDEGKLNKLIVKQNKKSLFGKKKNNEKWLFQYKEVLNNIISHYSELDDASFKNIIYTNLSQDSSILETLKLICSNYIYFINMSLKIDETRDINSLNDEYRELRNYVNGNRFYLLSNIALLDERPMKQLIVDKYNLEKVNLIIDNLLDDATDATIKDIETLINNENIKLSGINLLDVELYLEYQKLNKDSN